MRIAALFCAVFFSCAAFAYAEEKPSKAVCKAGTIRSVSQPVFGTDGGKSELNRITGTNNFCVSERITLGGLLSNEIINEATCICRSQAELDSVGCKDGQKQPLVTIDISKQITKCTSDRVVISKCAADPEEAYEEACRSGTDLSYVSSSDPRNIEIAEAGVARNMPSLGIHDGSETLKKALTASGVSEEKAQEIVTQNRQAGIDYIRALAGGDGEAAKTRAEALGVNANLSSSAQEAVTGVIRGEGSKSDFLSDKPFSETGAYQSGPTGFGIRTSLFGGYGAEGRPAECGVDGVAGPIMRSESSCGRYTYNPASNVQGPYQFLCGTWNSYAQSTGNGQHSCSCDSRGYYAGQCAAVHDPQIGARVVNDRYAQYQQQYGGRCASAGLNWNTCAYSIHFAGESGFQRLLSAYQTNPNMPMTRGNVDSMIVGGAYSANPGIFSQTRTVGDYFALMDRKMNGSTSIISYQGPAGQYSPFGGFTGQSAQPLVYNSASPFAQVNLAGDLMQPLTGGLGFGQMSSNRPPQYRSPYQQQQVQPSAQQPAVQQPVQQQVSGTTSTTQAPDPNPPKAVASVHIQPKSAAIGKAFTVSWTSVGTKKDCVLTADGREVAREGSGTRRVTMQIAATVRYTLSCTALSGEKVEVYDTVTVQ